MSDEYAFPVPDFELHGNRSTANKKGMTLRDYFAAQVMAGDAANAADNSSWQNNTPDDILLTRAKFYYRVADAMLKARE